MPKALAGDHHQSRFYLDSLPVLDLEGQHYLKIQETLTLPPYAVSASFMRSINRM
jgi:hypothetical protein